LSKDPSSVSLSSVTAFPFSSAIGNLMHLMSCSFFSGAFAFAHFLVFLCSRRSVSVLSSRLTLVSFFSFSLLLKSCVFYSAACPLPFQVFYLPQDQRSFMTHTHPPISGIPTPTLFHTSGRRPISLPSAPLFSLCRKHFSLYLSRLPPCPFFSSVPPFSSSEFTIAGAPLSCPPFGPSWISAGVPWAKMLRNQDTLPVSWEYFSWVVTYPLFFRA